MIDDDQVIDTINGVAIPTVAQKGAGVGASGLTKGLRKPTLVTAIHEAGHAVAFLCHARREVRNMSLINQATDVNGSVAISGEGPWELAPRSNADWRRRVHEGVIEYLAGPVAGLRQRGGSWASVELHSAIRFRGNFFLYNHENKSDFAQVQRRLTFLYGEATVDQLQEHWLETMMFVKRHWRPIERLGRWLWKEQFLDGQEIYDWWWSEARAAA